MKVLIVYYSMYGHVHRMAEAVAEGAKEIKGAEVEMRRVPETLSQDVLAQMGALEAQKSFSQIPVCTVEELASADAVVFGTPTRFGNMCGQMRQFLDATGQLWAKGAGGKGGKRVYKLRHPAWGPGIHPIEFSYYASPSWFRNCGAPLLVSRTDAHG